MEERLSTGAVEGSYPGGRKSRGRRWEGEVGLDPQTGEAGPGSASLTVCLPWTQTQRGGPFCSCSALLPRSSHVNPPFVQVSASTSPPQPDLTRPPQFNTGHHLLLVIVSHITVFCWSRNSRLSCSKYLLTRGMSCHSCCLQPLASQTWQASSKD